MALSVVFMFLGAIICLIVPTLIAVIMKIKRKASLMMFMLGVASFTASQLLLRIPLLSALQNTVWFNMFMVTQGFAYMLILALTAGIFEETGRYVALRFLNRDLLTWENGLMFGLGHGGVEAFWLVGLGYVKMIADTLSGNNAGALGVPPFYFLIGGVERIFAVALHIGFTMLVLYAVKRRKLWVYLLAVLAHGLVDAASVLLSQAGVGLTPWELEGIVGAFAVLAAVLTVMIRPALRDAKTVDLRGQERINI